MIRKNKSQSLYNQIKKKTTEHQICPMNEKVFIYNFRSLIHVIIIHFWGMLPLSNIKEGDEAIKKKMMLLVVSQLAM